MQTDTTAMNSAAGHVETVRDQLSASLGSLERESSSVARSWQGSAAGAFSTLMSHYQEASSRLHTTLSEIADTIRANGTSYAQQEANAADALRAVSSSAGALNL